MPIDPSVAHLSGPIPGSSLTVAPGSVPWEKPPMFTQVDDAIQYILKQFQSKDVVHQFLATMEMGAPLDTVVWTTLQHGFMSGKWSPSLALLLIKPVTYLFTAMLKRAGVKYITTYSPKKGQLDDLFAGIQQKDKQAKVNSAKVKEFMIDAKSQDTSNIPTSAQSLGNGLMVPPQAAPSQSLGNPPPAQGAPV